VASRVNGEALRWLVVALGTGVGVVLLLR